MAYIRVVDEDEAEGELFRMYDELQRSRGRVSNVMRIHSLHPKGMSRHLDLYMELLYGKGPLSRQDRELLGVVVSAANGCEYCVVHHTDALRKHAKDEAWVDQVAKDARKATMEPAHAALRDYALDLTTTPAKDGKARVQALRDAGFDDDAILAATEIVAYFNFVNRLVHGLGVDLEDDPHADYHY